MDVNIMETALEEIANMPLPALKNAYDEGRMQALTEAQYIANRALKSARAQTRGVNPPETLDQAQAMLMSAGKFISDHAEKLKTRKVIN